MEMSKKSQEKISQIQIIEQNMQNLLMQKQNYQTQLMETESALNEMKGANKTYKIVGNIMLASDPKILEKDLKSTQEMLNLRITSLEKQEAKLREKAEELQSEILKELKK